MKKSLQFWEKDCALDQFLEWCHPNPAPRWKSAIANIVVQGGYKTVLDAGCGTGQLGELLREKSADIKYTGLELTPKFVEFCTTQGLHCIEADISSGIPFDDEGFDCVTCLDVINYEPDYRERITELARVTRTRGLLIMSFFKGWGNGEVAERSDGSGLIEHFINLEELVIFLDQELGLKVKAVNCPSSPKMRPRYLVCYKPLNYQRSSI